MANITVSAQLNNNGNFTTLTEERDVKSLSSAIEREEFLRKQFSAMRNLQTTISVVLSASETPEQLRTSAQSKGREMYGPFTSQRSKITRYLIGMPKGAGPDTSTGTLD